MNRIHLFKTLLVVQTLALLLFTIHTFRTEGANLLEVFIENIMALNWSGQFNLDFSCYLSLSALWIAWRNKFTVSSVVFGCIAMVIGILAFAPCLFCLTVRENGDMKKVLIGER